MCINEMRKLGLKTDSRMLKIIPKSIQILVIFYLEGKKRKLVDFGVLYL